MKSKILATKEPLINGYTVYGLLFSILPDNMMPWVYNNFIQIRYSKGWNIVTFDNHHMFLSHCPGISFRTIPYNILNKGCRGSVKEFITDAINENQYVFMYADRYYLKQASGFYTKEHTYHEVFIYGYDLEEDLIYLADNLEDGKFIFFKCSFAELEQGYRSIDSRYDFMTDLGLLSVNPGIQSYINTSQITDGLQRYLTSGPTFDMRYEQPCEFGINVIQLITDQYLNGKKDLIDIRPFHLLYEHKLLMEMRVDYLLNTGYLSPQSMDRNAFAKLKADFLSLRNMVLKYNLVKTSHTIGIVRDKLIQLSNKEQALLKNLILQIKDDEKPAEYYSIRD